MGNRKYTIITFFSLAIFLISMAFFTINITYAYKEEKNVVWDIHLGDEIKYTYEDKKYEITSNNEYINFKVSLVDYGDGYGFMIPVVNGGNVDAYLKDFNQTVLDEEVGKGESGKIYHVKDYVDYSVKYGDKTPGNSINAGANLQKSDLLKARTMNYIMIDVKFVDKSRLSNEAIEVLDNSNFKIEQDDKVFNGFNLDLELDLNYQELK